LKEVTFSSVSEHIWKYVSSAATTIWLKLMVFQPAEY